jgi:hypothetical protein
VAVDAQGNQIPDPSAPATTGGSGLGDLLAGIGGANINRPAMGAQIGQGQALAGLRTAQTENALLGAQAARDEADARSQLEGALTASGLPSAQAHLQSIEMIGKFGNAQQAMEAYKLQQENANRSTLASPTATPQQQVLAQQGIEGKVAPLQSVPNAYAVPAGQAAPTVHVSPIGAADISEKNAMGAAASARAANVPNQMDPAAAPIIARFIDQNPNLAGNMRSLTANGGPMVAVAFMAEHGDTDAQALMSRKYGAPPTAPASGPTAPGPVAPGAPGAAPGSLPPGAAEPNGPYHTPPNGIVPAPGVSLKEQSDIRNDFAKGTAAKQTTALNTAFLHSQLLDKVADQIGNGQLTPTNEINVLFQRLTGSPAPTNLQTVTGFLGREAVRATVNSGAGTGEERELAVGPSASPEQMHGLATTIRSLLGGQVSSLDMRARRGGVDIKQLLTPEAQQAYGLTPAAAAAHATAAAPGAPDLGAMAAAELARRGVQ